VVYVRELCSLKKAGFTIFDWPFCLSLLTMAEATYQNS
jgi:hypothetical protein